MVIRVVVFPREGYFLKCITRDVTIGATGASVVAPKVSDTLTLSQPKVAGNIFLWLSH